MQEWDWFGHSQLTKGQMTQMRVIEAALPLFSRDGFNAVTLQSIGKASNTSHPLILKYFGSKENLLHAVRRFVSFSNHQWVDQKVLPSQTGREKLITHCLENLKWGFEKSAEAKIILLTYYYSSLSGPESKTGQKAFKMGYERLLRYLQECEKEGDLPKKADVAYLAELIHEYIVGLFVKMLATDLDKSKRLPASYKKKVETAVDLFLAQ